MALETIPPLPLLALRFVVSGGVLLLIAWWKRWRLPQGRELRITALQGMLMLGIGNGCLVQAETWIPSGLAAVFITISPFWLLGMDAFTGGERITLPVLSGFVVAFGGVLLLMGPDAFQTGSASAAGLWKGLLILQLGNIAWNAGSLMHRRRESEVHSFASGAIQQFATGIFWLVPALATGSFPALHASSRSIWALLWLVVFGSIIGFTSYIYALEKLPVAVVSLYNYINPVVAVTLGWLFYREPFGRRELLGMVIIFAGVALVRHMHARHAAA